MGLIEEDRVLIKNLYLLKGYGAKKLMKEFPTRLKRAKQLLRKFPQSAVDLCSSTTRRSSRLPHLSTYKMTAYMHLEESGNETLLLNVFGARYRRSVSECVGS